MYRFIVHLLTIIVIITMTSLSRAATEQPQVGVLAASIGVVQLRSGETGILAELTSGAPVYLYDEIITGPDTRAQILMRDETTFSIGADTSLIIDEFIFDPNDHADGQINVHFKKGVFRFISGRIAKANPINMEVKAGNAVIAVRGTEVIGTITPEESKIVLLSGQIDMKSISDICQNGGAGCSQSLTRPGFGVALSSIGQFSAPTRFDVEEINNVIGALQVNDANDTNSNNNNEDADEDKAEAEEDKADTAEAEKVALKGQPEDKSANKSEDETSTPPSTLSVTRANGVVALTVQDDGKSENGAVPEETIAGQNVSPNKELADTNINPITQNATGLDGKPQDDNKEVIKLSDFDLIVMRALGVVPSEEAGAVSDGTSTRSMNLPENIKPVVQETDNMLEEDEDEREITEEAYEKEVEEAADNLNEEKEEESSNSPNEGQINNTNSAPQLTLGRLNNTDDTSDDDVFVATTAAATASDTDAGDTLTYGLNGSTQASSLSGYDIMLPGSYGRLHLNTATGAYSYVPDDEATEGLTETVNDDFQVTVTDGTDTVRQTLSAVLRGVNDTPVLAIIAADSYTDTAGDDSFSDETGALDGSDRDEGQTLVYGINSGNSNSDRSGYTHALNGDYGTLYMNSSSGAFIYVPDDTKIEELKTTATDTFALTLSDGTAITQQNYQVTLNGVNDTPSLASLASLSFTDSSGDDSFSNATGDATGTDRDAGETMTYSLPNGSNDSSQSGYSVAEAGTYGTLYLNTTSGAYLYIPDDAAIEGAKTNETDQFSVQVSDGALTANQTLTASITGANDTPILGNLAAASFTDTSADDSFSNVTATASASDADTGDTVTYAITGGASDSSRSGFTHSSAGSYGTLYINSTSGAYIYVVNDTAIEGAASTVTDTFTVSASDGSAASTSDFVATINGVNDTPVLASISGITITDTSTDDTFSPSSASLSASDRDSSASLTYAISGGSADTSVSGFTHSSAGSYGTIYVNETSGEYRFIPLDSAVEALSSTVTEDFTLEVNDGAATSRQTLTTTLQGVNDAPTLASLSGFNFTDTDGDDSFSNVTGTASGSDRDSGASLAYSLPNGSSDSSQSGYSVAETGSYGTIYLNTSSGAYLYIPNDSAIEGATSSQSDQFSIQVSDGSLNAAETLTASITGVNDSPVLGSVSGITLTDTAAVDAQNAVDGAANASDVDTGDAITYGLSGGVSDTSVSGFTHSLTGTYGMVLINSSSGAYRFLPNASAVDGAMTTTTESFTITASDGTVSATTDLVATVNGVDDTPILLSLDVISLQDTENSDTFTTSTGTASGSNAESSQSTAFNITGGVSDTSVSGFTHSRVGTYGTFFINSSSGAYQYVPNNSVIEALKTTENEIFEVTFTDGVTTVRENLGTTLAGVNDRPTLAVFTGITYTDTVADDTFTSQTGTASGSDADTGEDLKYAVQNMQSVSGNANYSHLSSGTYGDLYFNTSSGAYSYVPYDRAIEALASSATDVFTLETSDGSLTSTQQTLTVTLNGVDDRPIITPSGGGSLTLSTGSANSQVATVTDAESHSISDISSSIASLPSWLSFGTSGSGNAVQYYWETGANDIPWLNGSTTIQLKASANSLDSDTESVTITFQCQSDLCSQFAKSTDATTPVSIENAANVAAFTNTGVLKIGGTNYTRLTDNEVDGLFDANSNNSGEFRLRYTADEANAVSPGKWTINQHATVDYSKREIVLQNAVSFDNIEYFDGDSGSFNYQAVIDFSGNQDTFADATYYKISNPQTGLQKGGQALELTNEDYMGFLSDGGNENAAVGLTTLHPKSTNAAGYRDTNHGLIEEEWRLMEPQ